MGWSWVIVDKVVGKSVSEKAVLIQTSGEEASLGHNWGNIFEAKRIASTKS
jgi:hypothetical protein